MFKSKQFVLPCPNKQVLVKDVMYVPQEEMSMSVEDGVGVKM